MSLKPRMFWRLLVCLFMPLVAFADLLPGDFAVIYVSKDKVVLMALKQIPQSEEIRVTDDFWINGAFDDSGNEAIFSISQNLDAGELYLLDLEPDNLVLDWDKTLHFYQPTGSTGTSATRHLFMIEANLEGLRWFPTPPGLEKDLSHIVLRDIDTLAGEINHIIDDDLIERNLTPFQWHRALGSFRAWIDVNDFPFPVVEFLDYQFSVESSPGIISFISDTYNIGENAPLIDVPVRRQYGSSGNLSVQIESRNEIAPLSRAYGMGPSDYYADLTSVAYAPSLDTVIAVGPTSGELLEGSIGSGWVRHDTNGSSSVNLQLTGLTYDGSAFWACSLDGNVYKSSDGINWVADYTANAGAPALFDIRHFPGAGSMAPPILVAVGANGRILFRDPNDGWLVSQSNTSKNLYSVAYDGSNYVAVGKDATILATQNIGNGWQAVSNSFQAHLYGVTYAPFATNGGFYAVGQNGIILYTDHPGNGFTKIESGTRSSLFDISFLQIEIDPTLGVVAEYLIACGASGTVCVAEEGSHFELRRGGNSRATALYTATPITDSNGLAVHLVAAGEYGARVRIETLSPPLSGDPATIKLDNNPTTNLTWLDDENSEQTIAVDATSIEAFRQQIELCIKRPVTGGGGFRIGRRTTEVNLMDATNSNVFLTSNFGPLLYTFDEKVEINPSEEWELKFRVGNTSNVESGPLFVRFEGTNLPDWPIPDSLLPGGGLGIEAFGVSGDIVHMVGQPIESFSLYEYFTPEDRPEIIEIRKYRKNINSLWVSPDWKPNGIFPRSLGVYLQDDGSLTNPGVPGLGSSSGSGGI